MSSEQSSSAILVDSSSVLYCPNKCLSVTSHYSCHWVFCGTSVTNARRSSSSRRHRQSANHLRSPTQSFPRRQCILRFLSTRPSTTQVIELKDRSDDDSVAHEIHRRWIWISVWPQLHSEPGTSNFGMSALVDLKVSPSSPPFTPRQCSCRRPRRPPPTRSLRQSLDHLKPSQCPPIWIPRSLRRSKAQALCHSRTKSRYA